MKQKNRNAKIKMIPIEQLKGSLAFLVLLGQNMTVLIFINSCSPRTQNHLDDASPKTGLMCDNNKSITSIQILKHQIQEQLSLNLFNFVSQNIKPPYRK
jgi:hypothetical protein